MLLRHTLVFSLLACSAATQIGVWRELAFPTSPSGRYGVAIVYDSARDRLVMVGGTDNNGMSAFRETWEHDGAQWSLRTTTGPRGSMVWYPQEFLAAAYDSLRQRTVVVQSNPSDGTTDTLEWNGSSWLLRSSTMPVGRWPAMCYDSQRQRTMMFGGQNHNGVIFNQTRAFAVIDAAASSATYGTGCRGPNGLPVLSAQRLPRLGMTFTLSVSNVGTGLLDIPIGWLGFDASQWNGVPLPAMLDPLGFPGCTALLAPEGSYPLQNVLGTATWNLPVPFLPAFSGIDVYTQAGVLALGFNPGGLVFTNGVRGRIGY
ncbi:MAG: hypothetical protein R3E87_27240 [Burkholderiaceae bacterium]